MNQTQERKPAHALCVREITVNNSQALKWRADDKYAFVKRTRNEVKIMRRSDNMEIRTIKLSDKAR